MLPETYKSLDVSARILPDNSETLHIGTARTMVYVLSFPLGTTMVGSSYYMSLG
ncbi:hypothetical protein C8Q72DRAFT_987330 [Fomitopsis betulina]|nr:hypothetical protein C8Q72DRAFT_987330 [Fomitopsis betulina]